MRLFIINIILVALSISAVYAKKLPPLTTVDKVDLKRYTGVWYQFGYFPNRFQSKDAVLTTAEYSISPKGHIKVINSEYDDKAGKQLKKKIEGKAFVVDSKTNSKLNVQFFWPFKGPYWIVLLDKDAYQWAVVSDPSRKFLWILTRKPSLSKELYADLVNQIAAKQIDTGKIVITGWFE